jgi:hypothetical protein
MSRFLGSANEWILSWQQSRHGQDRDRRTGRPETKARRNRSRKQLTMEPIEERVLLSASPFVGPGGSVVKPIEVVIQQFAKDVSTSDQDAVISLKKIQAEVVEAVKKLVVSMSASQTTDTTQTIGAFQVNNATARPPYPVLKVSEIPLTSTTPSIKLSQFKWKT